MDHTDTTWNADETQRTSRLISLLYEELRELAANRLRHEPQGVTIQATDLVHEAFFKLQQRQHSPWQSRQHFFGAAAQAMRQILIEHARRRRALKRGGQQQRVPLDVEISCPNEIAPLCDEVDLAAALDEFTRLHPKQAKLVELVHYCGLSVKQAAMEIGVCERTGLSYWKFAKGWLRTELEKRLGGERE